jgi:hypothetical protein
MKIVPTECPGPPHQLLNDSSTLRGFGEPVLEAKGRSSANDNDGWTSDRGRGVRAACRTVVSWTGSHSFTAREPSERESGALACERGGGSHFRIPHRRGSAALVGLSVVLIYLVGIGPSPSLHRPGGETAIRFQSDSQYAVSCRSGAIEAKGLDPKQWRPRAAREFAANARPIVRAVRAGAVADHRLVNPETDTVAPRIAAPVPAG